ncbi:hypothetical protein [Acetobacter sp.]|uniref:hypothetical protein n=1 Tax=Acetobacter sp. TaxID=440 RepID=UPI0039E99F54
MSTDSSNNPGMGAHSAPLVAFSVRRSTIRQLASRHFGGRPRKDETKDQARARHQAERLAYEGERAHADTQGWEQTVILEIRISCSVANKHFRAMRDGAISFLNERRDRVKILRGKLGKWFVHQVGARA